MNTIPTLSHLQFLVLDLLADATELSAQELQAALTSAGQVHCGPKFYQLMKRLHQAGHVDIRHKRITVPGSDIRRSFYRLTDPGRHAHRATLAFYQTRLQPGHTETPETPPMTDHDTNCAATQVALADIVHLNETYKGFTMGIVAEILNVLPDGTIRTVSLYLYNPKSNELYVTPAGLPAFVDFHYSAFTLYKRAADPGYDPVC